jgi:hypothetical protein
MLLDIILAQWRCPVASSEAPDFLHWAMRAVLSRRTAAAIKMASKVGPFFHHCFVCCCPGGCWGDTERVVSPDGGVQWLRGSPGHAALGNAICIAPAHRCGHRNGQQQR